MVAWVTPSRQAAQQDSKTTQTPQPKTDTQPSSDIKALKKKTRELEKKSKELEKLEKAQKELAAAQARMNATQTRINAFEGSSQLNRLSVGTDGETLTCKFDSDEERKNIKVTRAVLVPKEASDMFGRRIGRRYISYQITVANNDKDFQYMVHDIRIDLSRLFDQTPGTYVYSFSSRELSLLRGVPEKGQDLDPRNLSLHILTGIGSVAAAVAGLTPFTDTFGPAMGVYNGPLINSYGNILFPDHTSTQLNRLSDSAFAANTVVPKTQAKVFAIFVPQSEYLSGKEQNKFWDDPKGFLDGFDLRTADVCVDGTFIAPISSLSPLVTDKVLTDDQAKNFQNYNGQVTGVLIGQNFSGGSPTLSVESPSGITGTIAARSDTQAEFTLKFTQPVAPSTNIKMTIHKDKLVGQTELTPTYKPDAPTFSGISFKSKASGKVTFTVTGTNFVPGDTVLTVFNQEAPPSPVNADRTSFDVEVKIPDDYATSKQYNATLASKSLKVTVGTKAVPAIP
jgi:hypothetical protein